MARLIPPLSALALLLLPALSGANERPVDLPDAMLLSSFTEMCRFWTEDSIAQEKAQKPVDRSTLATCAWMLHSQAQIQAGRDAQTYDAWSETQPVLTRDRANDAAFLHYYRQYISQFAASREEEDRSQGKEVREISELNYEALRYGLIAAENVSPVRLRMLRLLVTDALRDGRVDVEEYAMLRPVIYDSSILRSTGVLSLTEARQALTDELAREGSSAR
ncbi:hypothetical protein ACA373_21555 [Erwinia sp. STN24]|jgi:hypothetical protein|uniref:hypothetical protein n=1 Tax=Erwinia sp. STN24 TaxID=3233996 RepID=UPI003522F978